MNKEVLLAGLAAMLTIVSVAYAETYTMPGSNCSAEDRRQLTQARYLRFSGGKIKNAGFNNVDISCTTILVGRPQEIEARVTVKNTNEYRERIRCTLIELASGGTVAQEKSFDGISVPSNSKALLEQTMVLEKKDSSVYLTCGLPPKFYVSNVVFESSE